MIIILIITCYILSVWITFILYNKIIKIKILYQNNMNSNVVKKYKKSNFKLRKIKNYISLPREEKRWGWTLFFGGGGNLESDYILFI